MCLSSSLSFVSVSGSAEDTSLWQADKNTCDIDNPDKSPKAKNFIEN